MSMSKTEKEQLLAWSEKVRTASTWSSGARGRSLAEVADEMAAVAGGDTTAKELAAEHAADTAGE